MFHDGLERPFGTMPAMTPAFRATETLRRARRELITVAADWQARGIDTEPLNAPLIEIQEALAELEALDVAKVAAEAVEVLGRDLRCQFNAVRVSGAGLEAEDVPTRCVKWLDLLSEAADQCIGIADRMDPLLSDE